MRKSFTLIEVLIAVFLLTLLIATAMMSFKVFVKRADDVKYMLPKNAIDFELVNKTVKGFYPYCIKNGSKAEYFFHYNDKEVEYVSLNGLYYNNSVVSKLVCEDNSLVYYESPLFDKLQNYNNPKILKDENFKIVLLKDLKLCKINIKADQEGKFPLVFEIDTDKINMIFSPDSSWEKFKDTLNTNLENL
jgi:hypothetical protein